MGLRHERLLQRPAGRGPDLRPALARHSHAPPSTTDRCTPCSSTSRAKTRRAVCRCLRGAVRSSAQHRIDQTLRPAPASAPTRTGIFRSGGTAFANACRTVRRCTPYLSANARTDNSSTRSSRRIASNNSTLDLATSAPPERRQQHSEPSGWGQIRPSQQVPGVSEVGPNQAVTVGPNQTDRATTGAPVTGAAPKAPTCATVRRSPTNRHLAGPTDSAAQCFTRPALALPASQGASCRGCVDLSGRPR